MSKKRLRHRPLGRALASDEFNTVVDNELGFLVNEQHFEKRVAVDKPFAVAFLRDRCSIEIVGESYGQSSTMSIAIDGVEFPWHLFAPNYVERFTPATDSPQADDIRESAYRLRNQLVSVLNGDYSLADQARCLAQRLTATVDERRAANPQGAFFSDADRLWKNKKWRELIDHLARWSRPLPLAWRERLSDAQKHTTGTD